MTVREFIEKHPDATMNLMTPGGYVTITPEVAAGLLQGEDVDSHPGANEHWAKVTAEELLSQEIAECIPHPQKPGCYYLLSGYGEVLEIKKCIKPGELDGKQLHGERRFLPDEIAFSESIVDMGNRLNFYMPTTFDTVAVIGDELGLLGEDDCYNIYADFDLAKGEVADCLEIQIIFANGQEDSASYQLSQEEKEMFFPRMDAFCQRRTGQSLEAWHMDYLQDQSTVQTVDEIRM